jgi:hypothetical protein
VGFYFALLGGLTAQIVTKPRPLGTVDWWLVYGLQVPVLIDWSSGRFRPHGGSNAIRILTGALAGLAFSRSFFLYFVDTKDELFWTNLVFVTIVVLAVGAVRLLNLTNLR